MGYRSTIISSGFPVRPLGWPGRGSYAGRTAGRTEGRAGVAPERRPASARPLAQLHHVVVRRPRGLRGVGDLAQVARRRQAALVAVEDVGPGGLLAVQGVDADPHAP